MGVSRRLLVVDDEPEFCEVLQEILETKGFEVDTAYNGKEALKVMGERSDDHYAVLIADINMPEMGGIELIRQTAHRYPYVVPVIVTGFPDTKAAVESLRVGAYDFISKPFKLDTIYLTVGRALEKHDFLTEKEQYQRNLELEVESRTGELRRMNLHLFELQEVARKTRETLALDKKLSCIREYCQAAFNARSFAFLPYNESLDLFEVNFATCGPDEPSRGIFRGSELEITSDGFVNLETPLFPGDLTSVAILMKREKTFGMLYLGFATAQVSVADNNTFRLLLSELEVILYNDYLVRHHANEMRKMFLSSVRAHAYTIEAKDPYTKGHCERVERFSMILGQRTISDPDQLFSLSVACLLHDIGKIGVSESILNKPGRLTTDEREIMNRHPVIGGEIVKQLYGFNLSPIIRHHHEWYNGEGYPDGLSGDSIPLESRLISVADTYDAMTSSRPYRDGLSPERAYDEILDFSGRQFDPDVVAVFKDCYEEFKRVDIDGLGVGFDLALNI